MRVLIDEPSLFYFFRSNKGRSYYLAEPPYLAICVLREGGTLKDYQGAVVDASIGWEPGYAGFCTPSYVGKKHGKITIYRVLEARAYEKTLSQFVQETFTW